MRKVKVVRRPVMLRVASPPLGVPAAPARIATGTVDDMPVLTHAEPAQSTITSELDDDLTTIAMVDDALASIATPRTSTSTVSAAARLAALKRTRK